MAKKKSTKSSPALAKMGRPSKCTPAVRASILAAVAEGAFDYRAAQLCGVSKRTFSAWKTRGERNPRTVYGDFVRSLKQASAEGEHYHVKNIRERASESWQASAWYLERKHHQRWGKTADHEPEEGAERKITLSVTNMGDSDDK